MNGWTKGLGRRSSDQEVKGKGNDNMKAWPLNFLSAGIIQVSCESTNPIGIDLNFRLKLKERREEGKKESKTDLSEA